VAFGNFITIYFQMAYLETPPLSPEEMMASAIIEI
jgi:hypothetical protein